LRIAGFVSAILRRGVEVVELAEETDSSGNTDLQTAMSKWLEKANNILGKWISMLDLEDILPGPLAQAWQKFPNFRYR
jgi:hypothetical protein